MRRRRSDSEGPSNDRWLVSYADFVTVLFGFFVFLYAISTAEQDQVRKLSDAVQGVFTGAPRTMTPIPIGEPITAPVESGSADQGFSDPGLREELGSALEGLVGSDQIRFREGAKWMEVTLPGDLVFRSGGVLPGPEAQTAIVRIAGVLASQDNAIVVEGHTDNLPIGTSLRERFPSNWELSAARAAAVARFLQSEGINPKRLSIQAFSYHRPVADNRTEEGRRRNRRIEIVLGEARP